MIPRKVLLLLVQQGLQLTNALWNFMTVTKRQIHPVLTRGSTTNANVIRDTEKMMPHNVKVKMYK